MRLNKGKKVYGFTLVELLIVVAIIGVLATIGIPTFRQMVQKAKKSEAKVALGGLYTVENAFYAEYGTYGNYIQKVGFDLEGTGNNRIYTVGFVASSGCGDSGVNMPDSTLSNEGAGLAAAFPSYYPEGAHENYGTVVPKFCLAASDYLDGHDFVATATGIIGPNVSDGGQLTTSTVDAWSMTRSRQLVNVVDGVQR